MHLERALRLARWAEVTYAIVTFGLGISLSRQPLQVTPANYATMVTTVGLAVFFALSLPRRRVLALAGAPVFAILTAAPALVSLPNVYHELTILTSGVSPGVGPAIVLSTAFSSLYLVAQLLILVLVCVTPEWRSRLWLIEVLDPQLPPNNHMQLTGRGHRFAEGLAPPGGFAHTQVNAPRPCS